MLALRTNAGLDKAAFRERTGFTLDALASALSIGVGASVGREGPVVHLGASLGSWVAKRLHLGRVLARTLLGCGVAAAVAASFNAPIAGSFFALEVVVGHYALSAFAPIVIASVTGTLISRARYGDYPAFILPDDWIIASFWEFPGFALLGLVSAAAAIVFMWSIMFTEDTVERLPLPKWSRPAFAGLLVGLIALAFPEVLGVGYEATDKALSDLYPLWFLVALIVAKTAATAISLGGGFAGGVFSPSLYVGAMVGGAYGIIATQAFPELSSGHGAYTIIGMGADNVRDTLFTGLKDDQDISSISATAYPHLKVVMTAQDEANLTAIQLKGWLVIYEPAPEGLIVFREPEGQQTVAQSENPRGHQRKANKDRRNSADLGKGRGRMNEHPRRHVHQQQ